MVFLCDLFESLACFVVNDLHILSKKIPFKLN